MDPQHRQELIHGIQAGRAATPIARVATPRETCKANDCHAGTSSGKPYCIAHIDQMPYIGGIDELPINKTEGP